MTLKFCSTLSQVLVSIAHQQTISGPGRCTDTLSSRLSWSLAWVSIRGVPDSWSPPLIVHIVPGVTTLQYAHLSSNSPLPPPASPVTRKAVSRPG